MFYFTINLVTDLKEKWFRFLATVQDLYLSFPIWTDAVLAARGGPYIILINYYHLSFSFTVSPCVQIAVLYLTAFIYFSCMHEFIENSINWDREILCTPCLEGKSFSFTSLQSISHHFVVFSCLWGIFFHFMYLFVSH